MKNTITLAVFLLSFLVSTNLAAKVHSHSKVVKSLVVKVAKTKSVKAIKAKSKITKTKYKGESGGHFLKDSKPLSDYQRSILTDAYKAAKSDGIKKPEILSGIIMQESKAGTAKNFRTAKHKNANDQTLGLSQMKVQTAKSILREYPELKQKYNVSDRNVYAALANNDKFNIAVASKYVSMMYDDFNYSDDRVIAAYNLGPGGAAHIKRPAGLPYVKAVWTHINAHKLNTL